MSTPPPHQEESQAQTALIIGIIALLLCGTLGPVAWVMGIVSTALLVLSVIGGIIFVAFWLSS